MLNEIRLGQCTEATKNALDKCTQNVLDEKDGILPTNLYSKNAQVDELNQRHLNELKGDPVAFISLDEVEPYRGPGSTFTTEEQALKYLDGCMAAPKIELKCGAQVMVVRNISSTIFNGSRGVIFGFKQIGPVDGKDHSPSGKLEL
jgi:ATP-dependent DNA helicase PIF1